MNDKTISRINAILAEYFKKNPGVIKVPAKDLMPLFVSKGIFPKDEKGGLPIRNLLRKLDKEKALNTIPYVIAERKAANTSWFFGRTKSVNVVIRKSTSKTVSKFLPAKKETVIHTHSKSGFPPVVDKESKVLILGSLPGDESISKGEYYAKASNKFWKLMDAVLGGMPDVYSKKRDWLLKNKIAIWDVLAEGERKGSLDSNIKKGTPNDFAKLYKKYPNIKHVFFNGAKAQGDYLRYIGTGTNHTYHLLPSSSGAHAIAWEKKCKGWEIIKSTIKKNN